MQQVTKYIPFNRKNNKQIMKGLIFGFLLFCSVVTFGQKLEGTIRYLMVQNIAQQIATTDYMSKQATDKLAYMIGNRGERKSYSILYLNATQSKYEDSEERPDKNDNGYSSRKDEYTITRNYEKKTMRDGIDFLSKTYIIEDSLRAPKWKILNEMKEVAGHICMNAYWNDTLKKQKVIGWYALDIQNSGGPERFFGLPGLILEVNINDGALVITADKIEPKKLTTELDFPKKLKGKKIKEAGYMQLMKKYFDECKKNQMPPFFTTRY